ncbi:hypothetical protein Pth03_39300 [Planotetraspora thailandica]|uniref:Uncharacterized protein n=1 Tax=Planotetraspora thailandica TaxID=487172 RepID=A0A8J3V2J7_9ACTN|nr:hypothetical protein Pth03_39300 [Planotetraspora thailandica]
MDDMFLLRPGPAVCRRSDNFKPVPFPHPATALWRVIMQKFGNMASDLRLPRPVIMQNFGNMAADLRPSCA